MSDWIGDFICSVRETISQGFRSLPVILGTSILILGLAQGNFNLLFFFVGLFILAPTAATIVNGLWELVFANMEGVASGSLWKAAPPVLILGVLLIQVVKLSWVYVLGGIALMAVLAQTVPPNWWMLPAGNAEACSIFTAMPSGLPPVPMCVVPSYWMTMMAFFFSYLFVNALTLQQKQANSRAPANAVSARKSQALTAMVLVGVTGLLTTMFRYATACETGLGVLISWGLGYGLASGWQSFMRKCGLGRLDDLFGISNRILPLQSYEEVDPTVCVPTGE